MAQFCSKEWAAQPAKRLLLQPDIAESLSLATGIGTG
jgi:hypothetical protein